jgi:hypothetical protein
MAVIQIKVQECKIYFANSKLRNEKLTNSLGLVVFFFKLLDI